MNKILRYAAVFLVFSWVSAANASIVETITNSNGDLTISGFNPAVGDTDANASTMDFVFDFADTNLNGTLFGNGDSGIVQVFEAINNGGVYKVNANFTLTALASTFNVDFLLKSQNDILPGGPDSVDNVLGSNVGFSALGTPLGTISVVVNGKKVTLDLLSVLVGGSSTDPILTLGTKETDTNLNLSKYLANVLDGSITGVKDGKVESGFTNANLTVVPEPATLLLLGSGLLGMFGFSRKRA